MKQREPISHIMTKQVQSVTFDTTLKVVETIFSHNNFHHLPVTKGYEVIGIISSSDLNKLQFGNLFANQEGTTDAVNNLFTLSQIMTPNPITVNPNDFIKDVAEIFANNHFHALPVVDNNALVGIISSKDIIKYLLSQY